MFRGEALTSTLYYVFGLPDTLWNYVAWEAGFASAGFLLGAFWRELPGRRGPVKSLSIALAYTLPIGVCALGSWALNEEQGILALASAAMLFVLTLTGMAMDLDTFRSERHYWPTRIQLLLSIYQMRFFSVQAAWVLAQLVGLVTLWQFFAELQNPPSSGGTVQGPGN
jgi:hypothetical protein